MSSYSFFDLLVYCIEFSSLSCRRFALSTWRSATASRRCTGRAALVAASQAPTPTPKRSASGRSGSPSSAPARPVDAAALHLRGPVLVRLPLRAHILAGNRHRFGFGRGYWFGCGCGCGEQGLSVEQVGHGEGARRTTCDAHECAPVRDPRRPQGLQTDRHRQAGHLRRVFRSR